MSHLSNGQLVYRKTTHRSRCLHTLAYHHLKHFVVEVLTHETISIRYPGKLQTEFDHVRKSNQHNSYETQKIQRSIKKPLHKA